MHKVGNGCYGRLKRKNSWEKVYERGKGTQSMLTFKNRGVGKGRGSEEALREATMPGVVEANRLMKVICKGGVGEKNGVIRSTQHRGLWQGFKNKRGRGLQKRHKESNYGYEAVKMFTLKTNKKVKPTSHRNR